MPTTTFIDECHSFVSKRSTKECNAPQRIPRSPNAFMLYRSDFLKSRVVPPDVEKRQQNLSRIAGQCWNRLSDTEKAIWFDKAAVVRAEHCAKYQSCMTEPFRKDKKRPSTKDKSKGATNSSFGRFRARRTRTPYCEGMFAALHGSISPSPESQAALLSPTPASGSPFPTTALLPPLFLPHVLPPFNPPYVTPDKSAIQKDNLGYPLDSLGSETSQWVPSHRNLNPEITSRKSGCQDIDSTLQQYQHDFASCVPYPSLAQLPKPLSDISLAFPRPSVLSSPGADSADCHSLLSNSTDALAHCNQSLVPLYLLHSNELNTSA